MDATEGPHFERVRRRRDVASLLLFPLLNVVSGHLSPLNTLSSAIFSTLLSILLLAAFSRFQLRVAQCPQVFSIIVLAFLPTPFPHLPNWLPRHTPSMPCTNFTSAKNVMQFAAIDVCLWRSVDTIALIASSKCQVPASVQRRTGSSISAFHPIYTILLSSRCARNCFLCPNCRNTLSVVPSDPPDADDGMTAISAVGEPPFFLYCNHCRWDSAEVDITFEKPTGLAGSSILSFNYDVNLKPSHDLIQPNYRSSKTPPRNSSNSNG